MQFTERMGTKQHSLLVICFATVSTAICKLFSYMFLLVSFALLKYLRKAFILLWLLGLVSCKDFKNWESEYASVVNIKFEPEKDKSVPEALKSLHSHKLAETPFLKKPVTDGNKGFFLAGEGLKISLKPDADEVSFEIESIENSAYYHKVTMYYERVVSLISPEAGGLQMKYTIKEIQLRTKNGKRPIFENKKSKIENSVPLAKEKEKTHVILYY